MNIHVSSPEEMTQLGLSLGKYLKESDVILLAGDLGVGKTHLSQAISTYFGILREDVTSPSFSLIQEYQGKEKIYHCDFYRLDELDEVENLGIYDWLGKDGIGLLEWADKFPEILPTSYLEIQIKRGNQEEDRELVIIPHGKSWENRLKEWTL